MRTAMCSSRSVSSRAERNSIAPFTDFRVRSWMFRPPTVTASTSGRSRAPLQDEHGRADMYSSIRSRWVGESVSLYRRSRLLTMPSNVSMYERRRPIRLRYCT